ncbi:MAG: pyridoxamine 5'-phosphate oxidase family protein [Chloroflexi bacterium]|nr:pyridoxamine 5'-phosphate oxidase family protein [Chloroflexota bacterium]
MKQDIVARMLDFISTNRLCVISTICYDGTPHSSVMHYSVTHNPLTLYFSTDDRSTKIDNIKSSPSTSVVIGWSEIDWITVQLRGKSRVITVSSEVATAKRVHYAIHPNSQKFENDPHTVFIEFTPQYGRFSDLGVLPEIIAEFTGGL